MKKLLVSLTILTTILVGCSKEDNLEPKQIHDQHYLDSIEQVRIANLINESQSGYVYSKKQEYTGITYLCYVTYKNCVSGNLHETYIGNTSGLDNLTEYNRPYGYKRRFWFSW